MSVSSLALWPDWRDYYSMWSPYVEPLLAPIERSSCHAPRYALVPDVSHQVVPASGKIEYNFHLPAGSLIWGLLPPEGSAAAIQLTDVTLGHEFFQEPVQVNFLVTPGGLRGRMPPWSLLPTPHPVVGDGLFTFEAWDVPGVTFVMLLGVAEVTTCPVK
jgi:hypothetical protein